MESRCSTGLGGSDAVGDTGGGGDGAYDVPGFLIAYHLSRSKFSQEVAAKRLRVMMVGTRTLISRRAAADWERLCEAEVMSGSEGGEESTEEPESWPVLF
jgi:hypothetical protein